MSKTEKYFGDYCDFLLYALQRNEPKNPSIKKMIRVFVREATHHAGPLPGYDPKKAATLISDAAKQQILAGDLTGLVGEHVVTVSAICALVTALVNPTKESIASTIRKWTLIAVITKAEDAKLKSLKLNKNMPIGWETDMMLRYKLAGITCCNESYMDAYRASRV